MRWRRGPEQFPGQNALDWARVLAWTARGAAGGLIGYLGVTAPDWRYGWWLVFAVVAVSVVLVWWLVRRLL